MSDYEKFQAWWRRATSGPGDFGIDKRSAEIGYMAALEDVSREKKSTKACQITGELKGDKHG